MSGEWLDVASARQGLSGAAIAASLVERPVRSGADGHVDRVETDPLAVDDSHTGSEIAARVRGARKDAGDGYDRAAGR